MRPRIDVLRELLLLGHARALEAERREAEERQRLVDEASANAEKRAA